MNKIFIWLVIILFVFMSYNTKTSIEYKTVKADLPATVSSSTSLTPEKYLGKPIDFDGNGGYDCFDLTNQWLFDNGVEVPHWKSNVRRKDILNPASLIVSRHKNLFGNHPYQVVSDYKLGDVVATTKGRYGHTAIVLANDGKEITVIEQDTFANIPAYKKNYPLNHFEIGFRIKLK